MKSPVWITSYCLTKGVIKCKINGRCGNPDFVRVIEYFNGYFKLGRDAFLNERDAMQNAEQKRIRKIESLRKQIAKLEKLKFED